jgi:hypothetical protein
VAPKACGDDVSEDVQGHRAVGVLVALHVFGEWCVPRTEDGGVQQREAPDRHLVDQMRSQHDPSPDVMSDQAGRVEAPVFGELGQRAGLLSDRRGDARVEARVAETEQVPHVHGVLARQGGGDLAPQVGPGRSAVDQDHWWSFAEDVGRDLTA